MIIPNVRHPVQFQSTVVVGPMLCENGGSGSMDGGVRESLEFEQVQQKVFPESEKQYRI